MKTVTDEELEKRNARDFEKDGCYWPHLTERQVAKKFGLKRVYTGDLVKGGVGGTLIRYERIE